GCHIDYVVATALVDHPVFAAFQDWRLLEGRRLVLLSTKAEISAYDADYAPGDILMLGRESAGVPGAVAAACDLAVRIPMRHGLRSINVALAGAMIAGEAMRQIGAFPRAPEPHRPLPGARPIAPAALHDFPKGPFPQP